MTERYRDGVRSWMIQGSEPTRGRLLIGTQKWCPASACGVTPETSGRTAVVSVPWSIGPTTIVVDGNARPKPIRGCDEPGQRGQRCATTMVSVG